ncbi:antibiotic biosynthesis monooxygenase [Alphaproteobacteria bacterium]|nr:antibiotic biosynthesis monooxygenase [Alphaproteobacteria bacterium]
MSDGMTPFVLLARVTVKPGKLENYMAISAAVDQAVEASEPGMLLHNFDQDPSDPHKLVWTEVYGRSDDFLFHADNPPVTEYVEKHADLADDFTIEIYGTVSQAVIDKINDLGVPLQYFQTSAVGYVRDAHFKV